MVAAGLAVAAVLLGALAALSRFSGGETPIVRNDFTQDYVSAIAMRHGEDPYAPTGMLARRFQLVGADDIEDRPNPHPPTAIIFAAPFTALDYQAARFLWMVVMIGCFVGASFVMGRRLGWSIAVATGVGIGVLALPVVQLDLIYLQWNGPILALLVLAWIALQRGSMRVAGVALGVASAVKLFPLIFLVPLLRARRRRVAAWQLCSTAVLTGVSFLLLGDGSVSGFLAASRENFELWRGAPSNISITALPFRWLVPSYWQPAAPSVAWLAGGLSLLIMSVGSVILWRHRPQCTRDRFLATLPYMVVLSPISWPSAPVLALPVLAALNAKRATLSTRRRLLLAGATAAIVAPLPGLPLPGPSTSLVVMLGYLLPTVGLIVVIWIDSATSWRSDRQTRTP